MQKIVSAMHIKKLKENTEAFGKQINKNLVTNSLMEEENKKNWLMLSMHHGVS